MAVLMFYKKNITNEGDKIEIKVWKVDNSKDFPQGIKYSLVYVHKSKRIIGYDNERKKGHHKHYFDKEEEYKFVNPERLYNDFENDVKKLREVLYDN